MRMPVPTVALDMMDGRVGCIRSALDGAGLIHTRSWPIRRSTRRASTAPRCGGVGGQSRQGRQADVQMDPANSDEALREVALDLAEGADMVMIAG